jgi:LmbE family N-acetylglucosaminyl deacetylase
MDGMHELELLIEVVGHLAAAIAFAAMVVYVVLRRRALRRTVRKAMVIYWLVFLTGLFFAVMNIVSVIILFRAAGMGQTVRPYFELVAEYLSLIVLSLIVLLLISLKVVTERTSRQLHILAIGAHPDDIEIACGATLARLRDAGHKVCGLVLTQGEQGGDSAVRPGEALSGAGFLGLNEVRVLDFADTRLREQELEIMAAIEETIEEYNPQVILTHSAHDQHQDHQAVHEATLRAGRNQGTILCYESPSVTKEFLPTFFVDIGDHVEVKIESVKEHWDQRGKPYMQSERVRGIALFRGSQAKTRYAEGFEVVRAVYSDLGGI